MKKIYINGVMSLWAVIFSISTLYSQNVFAQTKINLPALSGEPVNDLILPDCIQRAESTTLSITRAVCIAVERHPTIASAIASYSSQSDLIDAAKAGYYPQISLNMQGRRDNDPVNEQDDNSKYVVSPQLAVRQLIYDFGKVSSRVSEARGEASYQKAALLGQIDNIIGRTGNAVIEVKRLEAIEDKTIIMIQGIKKVAKIADSRASSGLSTISDSIQAKARLEAAEASLLNIRTELRRARVGLRTLLGETYQNADLAPITDSLFNDSIFRLKIDNNEIPDILIAKSSKSIAEAQLFGANADLYPTISLDASTEKTIRGNNPNTGRHRGTYNYVGVSLNQTLYSGGERSARRRSATKMLNSANFDIESALLELDDQVQSLRQYIAGTESRLKILRVRKQSIAKTRELYQEQYTLGSRPVLDLLNAEQELFQADADEVNAVYDMWSYYMQYIVVTGHARHFFNLNELVQASIGAQS